jgi:hypothetical protein
MITIEAMLCYIAVTFIISFVIGFAACLHHITTPESRAKDKIYREEQLEWLKYQSKELELLSKGYDELEQRRKTLMN